VALLRRGSWPGRERIGRTIGGVAR